MVCHKGFEGCLRIPKDPPMERVLTCMTLLGCFSVLKLAGGNRIFRVEIFIQIAILKMPYQRLFDTVDG